MYRGDYTTTGTNRHKVVAPLGALGFLADIVIQLPEGVRGLYEDYQLTTSGPSQGLNKVKPHRHPIFTFKYIEEV